MNQKVLIGIGVIVIIIIIGFLTLGKEETQAPTTNEIGTEDTTPQSNQTPSTPTQPQVTSQGVMPETLPAATVRYTREGFSPSISTITKGGKVQFINDSDELMWVASGPHPTHTAYPAFDQKTGAGKGGVYTFTFTEIGDWYFHNHLAPQRTGRVIVKQN
jgi:plastocyanin